MKIKFDITGAPEEPTLVLSTREGKKLGQIAAKEISMGDYLNEASVLQFKVYKFIDGVEDPLWDQLTNFKLVWCQDWDMWFQMVLDVEETTETVKSCECTKLGEAELSQIMLYNIEINTENDILRDDYTEPTIFYDPEDPSRSLLNRMMEKAPHYTIAHVDSTLANIQRTFTFDSESIYDSFQDVAEEIGCLFVFDSNSDEDGNIARTISVYDLESNCLDCGYRGEFTGVCPECGSTNIDEGYGEDTTIFVTADELSDDILFTTDTDSVKNCFRLEAGDDLTTATVRNCNPNGSQYIYYFSDDAKAEMPEELVEKIDSYDELYNYYQNEYVVGFEDVDKEAEFESRLKEYNELVVKYQEYNEDLREITLPIVGYPALMNAYYETIDFQIYLQSGLMPTVTMPETSAEEEAAKIKRSAFTGGLDDDGNVKTGVVAVANMTTSTSAATASNAVVNMAKCIVDMRYQVKSISGVDPSDPSEDIPRMTDYKEDENGAITATWTGALNITNYSDETDTFDTATFSLTVNGDYEDYLYQCIQKTINSENTEDMSITSLFALELEDFKEELKKYCLDSLNMFYDSCEAVLDVLVEQGIASEGNTWGTVDSNSDPYTQLYEPYRDKLNAISDEIEVREGEIAVIDGTYTWEGELEKEGLQDFLSDARIYIQSILDFETYLGETLWLQFCAYRREDTYSNSNYISDGLNNAELFDRALEFIEVASKELYKSAELQHSIESDLNNLLVMDKFKPLLNHFAVGNWLRVRIDDIVYKLRLIGYELEWENIENITLEFSDVTKIKTGVSDLQSIVNQASKMATSYDAVQHQASQGSSAHDIVTGWSVEGLNVTNTKIIQAAEGQTQYWDEHGMMFRKYDDITESYSDEQMKIVNSTIAITSDNWKNVRTAIGRFYYIDPETGMYKEAYGINAEVLIGKLILGEELGIYSDGNQLTFDTDGLKITNKVYTFHVNPKSTTLVRIYENDFEWDEEADIFSVSNDGALFIKGSIDATYITAKDCYNIYNSSGDSCEVISAILGDAGDAITVGGTKIDNLYLRTSSGGRIFTSSALYVGEDGGGDLYCGNINVGEMATLYSAEIKKTLTVDSGGTSSLQTATVSTLNGYRIASSNGNYASGAYIPIVTSPNGITDLGYCIDLHFDGSGDDDYDVRINTVSSETSENILRVYFSGQKGTTFYDPTGGFVYVEGMGVRAEGIIRTGSWFKGKIMPIYDDDSSHTRYPVGTYGTTGGRIWSLRCEDSTTLRIYGDWNSSSAAWNHHVDFTSSSSDARMKQNITDTTITNALGMVMTMKHHSFDWIDGGKHEEIGYIAQEMEEITPYLINGRDDEDDMRSINTMELAAITTKAIQEFYTLYQTDATTIQTRLDSLQLEVDELKEENESLKEQLATLTA